MENKDKENHYIELAKHCIGMEKRKPYIRHKKMFYKPYRNYFATGKKHEDWDVMVEAGYAERGDKNNHGGYTYYMTRAGLDWLGRKLNVKIHDESD